MIVLGEKYKFIDLEKELLEKKGFKLNFISYKEKNSDEIIKKIENELKKEKYKLIVLNTKATIPNELIQYLTSLELKGIKYITIENFLEKYLHKLYIPKEINEASFLEKIKPFSKRQYILKRIMDFSIAIPLGIISLPIMIYSAYRIKKESPDGPILFKQTRIEKNKKPFTCYKFRSMRTDIDFFNHYTQKNDPRIFPWGAFMRKSRIDELPQLWNVLKGDMHLLGPRAEWDELVKKYEKSGLITIYAI
ncbi:sugar transferase [Lebetimonas sp. JS032]|uniref:sugar transferase n=1 Tax=Lebetimonas sp. JS032 TaxID=990070 RepID=UPI0004BAA800|nr:sugar transferase [Lebetimonas sp. JS032]